MAFSLKMGLPIDLTKIVILVDPIAIHEFVILTSPSATARTVILIPVMGSPAGSAKMVRNLRRHNHDVFVNVNNHYESSAPKTIEKIEALLPSPGS